MFGLNASSFLPFSATNLCKVQMQMLGCGGLKLSQRCVSLFKVKVSCLGMALMVVSFCVFSVSVLFGNSLGDDVSHHFQFCSSSPSQVEFLFSWRLIAIHVGMAKKLASNE